MRSLLLLVAAALGASAGAAGPEVSGRAVLLAFEGAIGPAIADYVVRGLKTADDEGAPIVILRMDTPGGLDTSMRTIIRAILASPVPVASFVAPSGARAASAGTYIMYASHIAAMAPSTNLGAATPVAIGGTPGMPGGDGGKDGPTAPQDAMSAKAVNDAAAYIRGLAALRGRNADWAEKAVREAVSLTGEAARAENVIDFIARDYADLLAQADGRTVEVRGTPVRLAVAGLEVTAIEPDWRTRLLATITDPNVAYILMLIGIYGLLFELMNPGAVFPGVIGAISLLVGLYALNLLPIDYAGLGLILVGVALMVAEAFVPALGVLGIGGAVAFVIGSIMLFGTEVPGFGLAWPIVAAATLVSAAFFLLVLAMFIRSRRRPVVSGKESMIGAPGTVLTWINGEGHVLVHGEHWEARAREPLRPGQQVIVAGRDGLTLIVQPPETAKEPP